MNTAAVKELANLGFKLQALGIWGNPNAVVIRFIETSPRSILGVAGALGSSEQSCLSADKDLLGRAYTMCYY